MISTLRGTVLHRTLDSVVVDVGGVGFAVSVTADQARSAQVGERIDLHTHLIVRDDALSLVGFAHRDQLDVFVTLLGVSGIGPRSALGVLATLSIDEIATAVADEDDTPFRRVPGVGPKTAKLIVVQLHGKVAPPATSAPARSPQPNHSSHAAGVITALVGLGYPERVATDAVARVLDNEATDSDTQRTDTTSSSLLRRALVELGPERARTDARA